MGEVKSLDAPGSELSKPITINGITINPDTDLKLNFVDFSKETKVTPRKIARAHCDSHCARHHKKSPVKAVRSPRHLPPKDVKLSPPKEAKASPAIKVKVTTEPLLKASSVTFEGFIGKCERWKNLVHGHNFISGKDTWDSNRDGTVERFNDGASAVVIKKSGDINDMVKQSRADNTLYRSWITEGSVLVKIGALRISSASADPSQREKINGELRRELERFANDPKLERLAVVLLKPPSLLEGLKTQTLYITREDLRSYLSQREHNRKTIRN